MTKQMIQIESTDPGTYENAMANWITSQLCSISNVQLTRQEVLPGRPNLMAELPGDPALPALIMICHMDTVVVGDGWTLPPFEAIEKNGKIYGRGACDMKSGLACCLSAFQYAGRNVESTSGKTPIRNDCD
ncbi:MAG: M20/M25/M40 family metallo-hydrolase [Eubacterium ramulus]